MLVLNEPISITDSHNMSTKLLQAFFNSYVNSYRRPLISRTQDSKADLLEKKAHKFKSAQEKRYK